MGCENEGGRQQQSKQQQQQQQQKPKGDAVLALLGVMRGLEARHLPKDGSLQRVQLLQVFGVLYVYMYVACMYVVQVHISTARLHSFCSPGLT